MVKITIITINLNNQLGLEKTIINVINQSYKLFEYIVIDGGSSDNSLQVIEQYKHELDYWVSESDNGIYHAMNKGILLAKGEYCLFLNSGDWLANSRILQNVFAENPQADIISGDINFYDNQEDQIKWHIPSPDQLTAKTLFLGTLPHQATFIRKGLFDIVGLYNEKLKIASDWLFFVEAMLVFGSTYHHYHGTVAYFNMDGISCDPKTASLPRREQLNVLQEKYPLFLPDYEQLDLLEKQSKQWFQSREYRVYHFLERIGIIQAGVFSRRLKHYIQRTFFDQQPW